MKNLFWLVVILLFGSDLQAQDLIWGKSIHGMTVSSSPVEAMSLINDGVGNMYGYSNFYGTVDFDPGPGVYAMISSGTSDAYFLKMDTDGNLIWAKQFGNNSDDVFIYAATADDTGTVYLAGFFTGVVDFDPNGGVQNLSAVDAKDVFILSLDSAGNFLWVKQISGNQDQVGKAIILDESNNIYIAGTFKDTVDFNPGSGTNVINSTALNVSDVFILRMDIQGNFNWVKQYASSGNDAMPLDFTYKLGSLYIPMRLSGGDVLVRLDTNGNEIWSNEWNALLNIVSVRTSNNAVYVTGWFQNTVDLDPSMATFSMTSFGISDGFILRLDDGGNFQWAKQIGGAVQDNARKMTITNNGRLLIECTSVGTCDFDPGPQQYNLTTIPNSNFNRDIFLLALNDNGDFINVQQFGNADDEYPSALIMDNQENIIMAGSFSDTLDVDPGSGVFNINTGISQSLGGFLVKLSNTLNMIGIHFTKPSISIYPNPINDQLTVSSSENINSMIITDMLGRVVYRKTSSSNEYNISTRGFSAALYNVIVQTANGCSIHKIQISQ